MAVFFTADTHFCHGHTLSEGFCNRPFHNVESMNTSMIQRWNAIVQPGDVVYHLGDFAYDNIVHNRQLEIFRALNGRKVLVVGNHDGQATLMLPWTEVHETLFYASRRGMMFRLSHYPPDPIEHGVLYLHGHLHRRGRPSYFPSFDVGVDGNGFRPWAEHELEHKAAQFLREKEAMA